MPSSIKFVFMPPQDELTRWFAARLADSMVEYDVVSPVDDAEAAREIVDADGVFGWVSPELLPTAKRLRWLQNPDAGAVLRVLLRGAGEASLCDLESEGHLLRSHQPSHHDVCAGVV